MSLRRKMLIVTFLTVLILIVSLNLLLRMILLHGLDELDNRHVQYQAGHILSEVSQKLDDLGTITLDWASWDDSYLFVQNINEDYINTNMLDETFRNLHLNIVMFINIEGQVIWSKAFDLEQDRQAAIPDDLFPYLTPDGSLVRNTAPGGAKACILLSDGLLLVATRPILPSDEQGPAQGTLIFASYLDQRDVEQLSQLTGLPLTVYRADDAELPEGVREALHSLSGNQPVMVEADSDDSAKLSVLLVDIDGQPAILFQSEVRRDIYLQGLSGLKFVSYALIVISLLFGLIIWFALEKLVLIRLTDLRNGVQHIGASADLSSRMSVRGNDEVTDLSSAINSMLESLEASRQKIDSANELLQQSYERFRLLSESMPSAVAIYRAVDDGADFVFTGFNAAAERIEMIQRDAVLGRRVTECFPSVEEFGLLAVLRDVWLTGEPRTHPIALYKDERLNSWRENRVVRLPNSEIAAIYEDVTEKKRVEAMVEFAAREWSDTFDAISDMVLVLDKDRRILRTNRAFRDILDSTSPEGRFCYEIVHGRVLPPEGCPSCRTFVTGCIEQFEVQEAHLGGRWFDFVSFPIKDADGQVQRVVHVIRDINERKLAEAEHEKLNAQLTQAQKMESVGRLAGGVAHDFNNMLSVIQGYSELALERLDPCEPLYDELQQIHNAALHSADITRQLLAFARRQTVAPQVLDLSRTVEKILSMLRHLIGEDIDLLWQPAAEKCLVRMDPSQIDQILTNLCVNARDAITGVGKLTIETGIVTIDEAYRADHPDLVPGDFILLAVSDDGCGMDKEIVNRLFEPYFTTKGTGEGTGLGLATVYGIVRQNDGFINVYSEPEQGTTFKVYLRRHVGEVSKVQEVCASQIPSGHGETILIVENELPILEVVKAMLDRLGYSVLTAAEPVEAIRLTEKHEGRIDLLVTDVVMPEMNGRDLADKLTALYPNLKLLFMSGYTSDVIAHRGVLDEGVQFIQKPFSMEAIAIKVHQTLNG